MKEIKQKGKNYGTQVNIVDNSNLKERLFKSILISFGVLTCCYVFVLGNMISSVIERKSLENEARTLANDIGGLELTYLDMSSGIDLEYSHTLGFKEVTPVFAVREALVGFNTIKEKNIKLANNEI
ncbi:MAG: hypothetical protein AAB438_00335 [Patescibacteria group bacterium]